MALDGKVEEVTYFAGIAEGIGTLKIHPVEHLWQHLFRLGVEGEYRTF